MITKDCEVCGKSFRARVRPSRVARFCSRACRLTYYANPPISKTCEVCGQIFMVKAHRSKSARFCSLKCGGSWHMNNREMPRDHLKGNKFRKGLSPTNAFTSEWVKGPNSLNWIEPIKLVCSNCGTTFERKAWIVHQNKTKTGYRFCSHKCQYAFLRGEKSPLWVGGPRTYRGRSWHQARLLAVERDEGTCKSCGKIVGKSISVHHIRPFRDFDSEEEANSIDNLICLCQSCHMKRERTTD